MLSFAAKYSPRSLRGIILLSLCCTLLLSFAPSSQSLWIDESFEARVAMASGSLGGWLQMTLHDSDSEFFKPGHTLMAYVLSHFFGTTEHGFRMGNIIWGAAAVIALAIAGRRLGIWWLPLVFACHPFAWYYMDELRPYMMQLAAASWMLTALLFVTESGEHKCSHTLGINLFWAASFCCYSANMLGALSIASSLLALAALYLWRRQWPPREILLWTAPWIVINALLSGFFTWKMLQVHGKAGSCMWPLSTANVGFSLYELSGFMGFGAGRESLRAAAKLEGVHGVIALMRPYGGALLGFAIINLFAYIGMLRSWIDGVRRRWIALFAIIVVLNIVLMFLGAYVAGWPFWGRHLAPTMPFLVTLTAIGLCGYGRRGGKILVPIWIASLLIASLHMRNSGENAKDDYRSAAATANAALLQGKRVWWAADPIAANYYHLFPRYLHPGELELPANLLPASTWPVPLFHDSKMENVTLTISEPIEILRALPSSDLIILSKPDIYDGTGSLQQWMVEHNFQLQQRFPAFSIWGKIH